MRLHGEMDETDYNRWRILREKYRSRCKGLRIAGDEPEIMKGLRADLDNFTIDEYNEMETRMMQGDSFRDVLGDKLGISLESNHVCKPRVTPEVRQEKSKIRSRITYHFMRKKITEEQRLEYLSMLHGVIGMDTIKIHPLYRD